MANITLEMLRTKYTKLRETNATFSLRNYAKQLEIGSGRLSELFNGKRRVTEHMCRKWVNSPFFTAEEKDIMSAELGYSLGLKTAIPAQKQQNGAEVEDQTA